MDGHNRHGKSDDREPGPIPDRWLMCPRVSSTVLASKFLAFKTPLNARFSPQLEPQYYFQPDMVFDYMKPEKKKVGLWIDLTNTKRFYDRREVEAHDCRYMKLRCRGHGETPSEEQTQSFLEIVDDFIAQKPLEYVGVHCTHGFNRTGFLIVAYMVLRLDCSVEAALSEFAQARPPGIYKQDYINELFRRYDDEEDAIPAPPRPTWCLEYDDNDGEEQYDEHDFAATANTSNNKRQHDNSLNGHDEDRASDSSGTTANDGESSSSTDTMPKKRRRKEFLNLNATFMTGVNGVSLMTQQPLLGDLQEKIQQMCKFDKNGFPGSQPVSMDMKNISLLQQKPYRVSWKADGTRYMMLISKANEVYFFDRDNSCFKVDGLRFPCRDDLNSHISDTLIDGEMVIDKVNGLSIPRYLVYDIVCYNGTSYMENEFYSDDDSIVSRLKLIKENIIEPRNEAIRRGLINKQREPFSVRDKAFWDITQAIKLLQPKFTKNLGHEPDGLIFQPSSDEYTSGACANVLKWKPASMNSVDFKLKVTVESGQGIVTKSIGLLFVGGLDVPFARINIKKQFKDLNGKIIECKFENNQWVFMRERTDKSFPNSYSTALAVCESITNPVTAEKLEEFIDVYRYRGMMPREMRPREMMPPPAMPIQRY